LIRLKRRGGPDLGIEGGLGDGTAIHENGGPALTPDAALGFGDQIVPRHNEEKSAFQLGEKPYQRIDQCAESIKLGIVIKLLRVRIGRRHIIGSARQFIGPAASQSRPGSSTQQVE